LHDRVTAAFEDSRLDVYYYVLRLGLSPAQAQEVTQEVFLRLFLKMREGEEIENVRGWVFRVAHNFGLQTKAKEKGHESWDPETFPVSSAEADPEQQLLGTEREGRIRAAISQLSPQQQQVLHLRSEGLRYREIAAALGVATSTVNEFLRRGIAKVRSAVHE
jgi:RNA polymerase sigma-70 factor (ECF subfamily)